MFTRVDVARSLDLLQKVDEPVQELLHERGPERAHLDADLKPGRLDLDDDWKNSNIGIESKMVSCVTDLDCGDEVLPVGSLLCRVAGEVSVEVHDEEEGVHRDVGVGVAALADEALDGVETPVGKSNNLI